MRRNARKPRSGTKSKASRSATRVVTPEALTSRVRADAPVQAGATAIFVAVIAGTPLAILPAHFATYDTTLKLAILYVSAAVLLCLPGQWWPGVAGLWRTRVGRAFYSLLILGAVSLFISSAFSDDAWLSLAGTVWRRLGAINQTVMLFIAAAIAGYVYMDRKAARTVVLAMEAAGAIASAYAIAQHARWDPLIPAKLYTIGSPPAVRPPATLSQATFFATFLLPPILIAAWFGLHESSSRWKRAHAIVLFLTIAALFISGTRSALLGLAGGACVLLYLERARVVQPKALARAGVGVRRGGSDICHAAYRERCSCAFHTVGGRPRRWSASAGLARLIAAVVATPGFGNRTRTVRRRVSKNRVN